MGDEWEWKLTIEPRRKGGPGSGHWGHAGRPGQRGGSAPGKMGGTGRVNPAYFETGPGREMVRDLDPELRNIVVGVMVESGVRPQHLTGLGRITTEPNLSYGETWSFGTSGVYDRWGEHGGTIHISPDAYDSVAVMSHELGHHVTMGSKWAQAQSGVWDYQEGSPLALLNAGFEPAKRMVGALRTSGELYDMGLRKYSTTSKLEFMADSWKVYQFGNDGQKRALAKHLGVDSLDDIFGG